MARILAVDDEQAMLQLIRRVLEKDGHACTLVSDAAAVLNMNFSKYDLILLDVMMPGSMAFPCAAKSVPVWTVPFYF